MGLIAEIVKGKHDTSNGGISRTATEVIIVNVDGPFERAEPGTVADAMRPAVELVPGYLPGTVHMRPVDTPRTPERSTCSVCHRTGGEIIAADVNSGHDHDFGGNPQGRPMFGGAYIATSDSRLARAIEAITGTPFYGAVPLHDRFE